MFRCIARKELGPLQDLGERLGSQYNDHAAALLCYDHVYNRPPRVLQSATPTEAISLLKGLSAYCKELQFIVSHPSPGQDAKLQQLLRIRSHEGNETAYVLAPGSFLHDCRYRQLSDSAPVDESQELIVSSWDLARLIKVSLNDRLKRCVQSEDVYCSRARSLLPCPTFVVYGACHSHDCPRAHVDGVEVQSAAYHNRVRMVFLQIMIYQTICQLEYPAQAATRRRYALMSPVLDFVDSG